MYVLYLSEHTGKVPFQLSGWVTIYKLCGVLCSSAYTLCMVCHTFHVGIQLNESH